MTHPIAKGERFIAVAGQPMSIFEIAQLLRAQMGGAAGRVPRLQAPDWLVRILALFSEGAKAAVPQLGLIRAASNQKARDILGWTPRSNEDAILATAESLLRLKLTKNS